MTFMMNDRRWIIKEVAQEVFWEDDGGLDKMNNNEYYFGRTHFDTCEIWLYRNMSEEQKRKTLYHELLHCYRGMFLTFSSLDNQDEDTWCDITANAHDIIHTIIDDYFLHKVAKNK
jgi:hypothetical protein